MTTCAIAIPSVRSKRNESPRETLRRRRPVDQQMRTCLECNAKLDATRTFCGNCDHVITNERIKAPTENSPPATGSEVTAPQQTQTEPIAEPTFNDTPLAEDECPACLVNVSDTLELRLKTNAR